MAGNRNRTGHRHRRRLHRHAGLELERRATYDELVSTGTLGLIKSQTLRNTALQVYNFPTLDNVAREGMQSRYREAFRMTLPNDVLVPLLRLRIADLETRLVDLTGNNKDVMQGLQTIANE
jgi:hypothetical protein